MATDIYRAFAWPSTVLGALQFFHFILQTTLGSRNHYSSSHFIREETESHAQTLDLSHLAKKQNLCMTTWVPAMPDLGGGW